VLVVIGTGFVPGTATGIVTGDVMILTNDHVDQLVDVVEHGEHGEPGDLDIDDLLAVDAATLAVVQFAGSRIVVVARGEATVEVAGRERVAVVDDRRELEHVHQVVLRLSDTDDTEVVGTPFAVERGVVPAAVLRRELDAGAGDVFDAMFGHTVVRSVEAAAVRPEPAQPAPLGVLVFSTGERVLVDRSLVLGRSPTAELDRARPVKLAGAGVSRQHAVVTVDRWQACVDDLGSSNGTEVTLPGAMPQRVRPGHPIGLVTGARVDLGGDVSFVLEDVA
jgi:hypothetical protein